MNKPRSTLVFTNLPSTSPQSDFFGWCIFRFFFCIANMLNYGISLVFWGPFSLKTHLEVSSHARTRQVREQSSLQLNNFILEGHESKVMDAGLQVGTKNNQRQAFE